MACNIGIPLGIEITPVTGREPTLSVKGRPAFFGVLSVASHNHLAADKNFTILFDPDLKAWRDLATRTRPIAARPMEAGKAQDLSEAIDAQ